MDKTTNIQRIRNSVLHAFDELHNHNKPPYKLKSLVARLTEEDNPVLVVVKPIKP